MPPNQLCNNKSIVVESHQSRAVRPYNLRSKSSTSNLKKGNSIDHDFHSFDEERDENGSESDDDFNDSNDIVPEQQYFGRTLNAALQDHDEVDEDEKVNMNNEDGFCKDTTALANQKTICIAPTRTAHEKWPKDFEDIYNERIISTLNAFRDSKYTSNTASKRPVNLVITDSLMSSIKFQEIYKNTLKLFVGYPNYPLDVIDQMKYQIEDKENDYVIKNILISIGFDALVYYPDFIEAKGDTDKFLKRFVNSIKKAFNKNGPKRYNQVKKGFEENLEEGERTPIPIQPPKIIIATIPEIANHPTAFNYNMEIVEMNEEIKNFVNDTKTSTFKKHNIVLELYDWAKFSSKYDQCNLEHLHARNRILTVDLAEQYMWLMTPHISKNPAILEQDSTDARIRREIMENSDGLQQNANNRKKTIRFTEPLASTPSFVNDENSFSDFEMDVSQIAESNIDDQDSSIAQRLRKRKGTSKNHLSPQKKSKRTSSLLDCASNSCCEDEVESDDEEYNQMDPSYSILDPSKYETHHYDDGKIRIFVFASKEENTCYEFTKILPYYYRCLGCSEKKKYFGVYLRKNKSNGEYSVFMKDDRQHCCSSREYNPGRFIKKFIQSANFNFYNEKNSLRAVIFDDEKKFCYKFYHPSAKKFICYQCFIKKKRVTLKLHKNDEGQEYFSQGMNNHICEQLNYDEVISNMDHISSSDIDFDRNKNTGNEESKPDPRFYEIEKSNKCNPQLIVYTSSEKHQWYKYSYCNSKKSFVCNRCSALSKCVSAKYFEKNSSNDYGFVTLGPTGHFCEPYSNEVKFVSTILNIQKLNKELYKFEKTLRGEPQLIIYTSKEKRQYYKYNLAVRNIYRCTQCSLLSKFITAQYFEKNTLNEEDFVTLGPNGHVCEPISNDSKIPDEKKINKELYQFEKTNLGNLSLIIYTSIEKLLWYKYYFYKREKRFFCKGCKSLKKMISAKHVKGDSLNGDEYIVLGNNEHICEPFSNVLNISDEKIIHKELYQIEENTKGKTELIIYSSNDKLQCYKYSFNEKDKRYVCKKCASLKKYVWAKLVKGKSSNEYIVLGKNEHICEPFSVNTTD